MKKLLILAIAAALLLPAVSMAAVSATSHDMSTVDPALLEAGICSPCHIPHGAQGERLFPDAGASVGGGAVGTLCAYCHHTSGGAGAIVIPVASSDSYVYTILSHGKATQMNVTEHPDVDQPYLTASGLPYVSDATPGMECTSCHNVHDDTDRPFLRLDLDSLCSACHNNRHYDNGSSAFVQGAAMATWDRANSRDNNPGSHPVGTDVTSAFNATWQTITISAEFTVGLSGSPDGWKLGGHLDDGSATGGVVCVSCHAVHGAQDDADSGVTFGATAHSPYTNFLQIDQASTSITYTTPGTLSRSVASGFGDYNPLCEDCHNGTVDAGYTVVAGAVDPGATGFTHPLDGITPSDDAWVTAFPGGAGAWPEGDGTTYTQSSPVAICESCHVMHPEANNTATVVRPDINAVATTQTYGWILRDNPSDICDNCHTGSISGHHPVGDTYDSTDVAYLNNTAGAAGDTLTCQTCHSDSGAHNWANIDGIGLDPNWVPLDNGRDPVAANDAVADTLSETCMDCHFGADGDNTTYSPTLHDGSSDAGETGYGALGEGTHFMGDTVQAAAALSTAIVPGLQGIYTTPGLLWPTTIAGASGSGWSRFRTEGTYSGVGIACESCHELEPDKNNSGTGGVHLLLSNFQDGQAGQDSDGDGDGRDDFCEACHLPPGTHPMTGDAVDRRSGLAVTTLVVDGGAGQSWLTVPHTDTNVTTDAATERMSCDSCHQVHEAATLSYNMILDATNGDLVAGTLLTPADGSANLVPNFPDGNLGPNHQGFCQYCHNY